MSAPFVPEPERSERMVPPSGSLAVAYGPAVRFMNESAYEPSKARETASTTIVWIPLIVV